MKIKLRLRLVQVRDDLEVDAPEGDSVGSFLSRFLEDCGEATRGLILDPAGRLKVLTLVNQEKARPDQTLVHGDELVLVLPVFGG